MPINALTRQYDTSAVRMMHIVTLIKDSIVWQNCLQVASQRVVGMQYRYYVFGELTSLLKVTPSDGLIKHTMFSQ